MSKMAISVSTSRSGSGESSVRLQIEDVTSGVVVVHARIDPATWWSILSSMYETVECEFAPDLHHVGRRMEHQTIPVPNEVTAGIPYGENGAAIESVQRWAAESGAADEWETVEPYKSNQGWKATLRRWPVSVVSP